MDRVNPAVTSAKPTGPPGPSVDAVRKMLRVTVIALGVAALAQLAIYGLLIINRTRLLHPVLAGAAVVLSVLASLVAIATVVGCGVLLTRWLIARRSAAFARWRLPEPRSSRALWAGCLVPLVNLAWAPVYVIELAAREGQFRRLRKPIVVWWLLWIVSTGVSVFATVTSRAQDAQGIANNVIAMTLAYLLGLVTVIATARVFEGFERRPVQRPAHHWVVVGDDRDAQPGPAETDRPVASAIAVESGTREPAA